MERKEMISEFIDILIMKAGLATFQSMKRNESRSIINISLELRPSVIAEITEGLEVLILDQCKEEEKQEKLTKGFSLFLSDAIDQGIISSCRQVAEKRGEKLYHGNSRHP